MTVEKLVEAQENLVKYINRIIAHRDGYYGIDAGKRDAKYLVHMIVESALSTTTHDDAIRRDFAHLLKAVAKSEKFEDHKKYIAHDEDNCELCKIVKRNSAILGTEPAREES